MKHVSCLNRGFQDNIKKQTKREIFEFVPCQYGERRRRPSQLQSCCVVPLMARQFRHSGGIVLQAMASSAVLAMLSAVSSIGRARAFQATATTAYRCSSRRSCGPLSAYGSGLAGSSNRLTMAGTKALRSTTVAGMATAASGSSRTGRGRNSKVRMVRHTECRTMILLLCCFTMRCSLSENTSCF